MFKLQEIQGRGKALVATIDIGKDQIILEEFPSVSAQFCYNKQFFPACGHCLKSLEEVSVMLQRLSGTTDIPGLPVQPMQPQINTCQCGQIFCSLECMAQEHFCGNFKAQSLINCWQQLHYPPENASIVLLMKMAASQDTNWLKEFCHYEDVPLIRELNSKGSLEELYQKFCEFCISIKASHPSPDQFKQLVNVMALNAQGIGTSAIDEYEQNLPQTAATEKYFDLMEEFEEIIEEHSDMFTRVEGSGLYRVHSKLNHSCTPNAVVTFPYNSHVLRLQALQDIQQGQEITIAYIESCHDDDKDEVHEQLKEFYQFDCSD